jgi:hypothetical protein
MSAREALIRQNIEKARAKPETPAPKETAGKQASGMFLGAFAGPRSFFGGNYEVYSRLESIDFRSGGGDGSLRGNTACIRLWKRGGQGLQSQDPVSASTVSVAFDLNDALAKEVALLGFDPNFKTSGLKYDTGFEFSDFNLPSEQTRWAFQTNLSSSITGRQTDLATKTPSTKDLAIQGQPLPFPRNIGAFNPGFPLFSQRPAPVFATPPGLLGPSSAYISSNPFGTVLSANPNGFVNILARAAFGTALGSAGFRPSFPSFITGLRYPPPLNVSRANAMPLRESVLPRGEIMWQFLFNPSEMELEAGPEFKNAETWAVSDKANSGQPLHWAYNKNAQLKFNSILLNGYIFGRKVEELEQGLIELFMARDGDGQAGPHVLEFIWGKRKFGPCVIKNINVKEKMWDEGQVVNAELSFTLEQIPEWTINDGAYVDVARPGRQPLREEVAPNLQAGAAGEAGAGETPADIPAAPPEDSTKGAGNENNQKSQKPNEPKKSLRDVQCQGLFDTTAQLADLQKRAIQLTAAQERQGIREIQFGELISHYQGINALKPPPVNGFPMTKNLKSVKDEWAKAKAGDFLLTKRRQWMINEIQRTQDRLGTFWNNSTVCPKTARK